MKATDVEVRYGITKNLGNYESLRLDYSVRLTLEEGDKAGAAIDEGLKFVKNKVLDDSVKPDITKKS